MDLPSPQSKQSRPCPSLCQEIHCVGVGELQDMSWKLELRDSGETDFIGLKSGPVLLLSIDHLSFAYPMPAIWLMYNYMFVNVKS